jgi:hypothetical protein
MFSKNIWVENAGDGTAFAVGVTGPWTGQFWKGESMQQKILRGRLGQMVVTVLGDRARNGK